MSRGWGWGSVRLQSLICCEQRARFCRQARSQKLRAKKLERFASPRLQRWKQAKLLKARIYFKEQRNSIALRPREQGMSSTRRDRRPKLSCAPSHRRIDGSSQEKNLDLGRGYLRHTGRIPDLR